MNRKDIQVGRAYVREGLSGGLRMRRVVCDGEEAERGLRRSFPGLEDSNAVGFVECLDWDIRQRTTVDSLYVQYMTRRSFGKWAQREDERFRQGVTP